MRGGKDGRKWEGWEDTVKEKTRGKEVTGEERGEHGKVVRRAWRERGGGRKGGTGYRKRRRQERCMGGWGWR